MELLDHGRIGAEHARDQDDIYLAALERKVLATRDTETWLVRIQVMQCVTYFINALT